MKFKAILAWVAFVLAITLAPAAQAAITCTSITAPDITIYYVSNSTVAQQKAFTVVCSRTSTADANSVTYLVLANNGTHAAGNQNNVALGGNQLTYDFYTNACGGTKWDGLTLVSDTITWAAGQTGAVSRATNFWICKSPQVPSASGTYTDTVSLTMLYNPGSGYNIINDSANVIFYAPAVCTIPAGGSPGNISLAYTSFSAGPVNVSVNFRTQCTSGMPYTLDVSPTSGTLAGVNYTMAVSNPTPNGTGAQQTFQVTASAPAGQSGTCTGATCLQSRVHTLTVGY